MLDLIRGNSVALATILLGCLGYGSNIRVVQKLKGLWINEEMRSIAPHYSAFELHTIDEVSFFERN